MARAEHKLAGCKLLVVMAVLCALPACALPGLGLEKGGSQVWSGQGPAKPAIGADSTLSANDQSGIEVQEITPALIRGLQSAPAPMRPETIDPSLYQTRDSGYEYRVGPGDVLNVVVWNHPELTNPIGVTQSTEEVGRQVRSDGTVFYPYVGVVKVTGMTVEDIRNSFQESLKRVLTDPQVDVRVIAFRSQKVIVTSDMGGPCLLPINDKPLTVLDALALCSGTSQASQAGSQSLYYPTAILTRAGKANRIDLASLYRGGSATAGLLILRDSDRLHLEDNRTNRIFVTGEVGLQTALPVPVRGMSLADAIADAGGLKLDTADAARIYVIRGYVDESPDQNGALQTRLEPVIYQMNVKSVDALILADQFRLQPKDVVFASSASIVSWNRALSQILPSLNALFQTAVVLDRRR